MKLSTLLVTGLVTLTGVVGMEAQATEACRNIYRQATYETVCVRDNGERTNIGGYLATLGDSRPMSDYGQNNPVVDYVADQVMDHYEQEGRRAMNEAFHCLMKANCPGMVQSLNDY